MRKVFFSFLGTNDYLFCNYDFKQDEAIQNVRFIQEACIRHHCKDWTENDRIFIFMTEEARKMNWEDGGHEKNPQPGLKSILKGLHTTPRVEDISIPSGKSVEEIWEIFDLVFRHFEKKDRLFLDITHAFRSIPMLAMVILSYAKVMREIQVNAISYGAMEVLGSYQEVKQLSVEKRNVPVFDLLPFANLQDWVSAVDRFVTSGDARKIAELSEKEVRAYKKATPVQEQDSGINSLKALGTALVNFSSSIQTCRGLAITEKAAILKKFLTQVQEQDSIKPLKPLLQDRLARVLEPFKGNEIGDGLAAARWCLDHDLYQQGFTVLQETLISYIVQESTGLAGKERRERELVNAVVASFDNPDWKMPKVDKNLEMHPLRIQLWLKDRDKLRKSMRNITKIRNDLNHAGFNKSPVLPETFVKTLRDNIEIAEEAMAENIKQSF